MTAVYVASPLGFSEPGRHYLTAVLHPRLTAAGWSVLDPWDDQTGIVAETLALPFGAARREALVRMSRTIGQRNRSLLAAADVVLASGGHMVTTLDEAVAALESLRTAR